MIEVMNDTSGNVRSMWEKGYRIIPLRDKSPAHLGKGWQDRVPTNLKEAQTLFAHHPGDIGIFTPGTLLVADVDVKDGREGKRTWASLVRQLGPSGAHTVTTPSGGFHKIWLMPPDYERDNAMLGPGVDVRASSNGVIQGYGTPEDYPTLLELLLPPESWLQEFHARSKPRIELSDLETSEFSPSHLLMARAETWPEYEHDRSEWFYRVVAQAFDEGALNGDNDWLFDTACAAKYEERGDLEEQFAICWEKAAWTKRDIQSIPGGGIGLRPKDHVRAAEQSATFTNKFKLSSLESIVMKPVHWMWEDRIPVNEITLIAGREGVGKSTYLAQLAAHVTRGTAPGHFSGSPKNVIYVANEDSWSRTVKPRMMAAGVDPKRVFRIEPVKSEEGLILPEHCEELADICLANDVACVMLDPIISLIDGDISTDKTRELRMALEPLRREAERAGIAVTALVHFNKTTGADVLTKIAGARGWVEVARAVIALAKNDDGVCILSQVKNNLGSMDQSSLEFKTVGATLWEGDQEIKTSRIEWLGKSEVTAQQIIEQRTHLSPGRPESEMTIKIIDLVKELGPVSSADVASRIGEKADSVRKALIRAEQRNRVKRDENGLFVII